MQRFIMAVLCSLTLALHAESSSLCKFEGQLGNPVPQIKNMNFYATAFIPYNSIIVEVGAYEGGGTIGLASGSPYVKIFAFEPNPKAFSALKTKMNSFQNVTALNMAVNTYNGTAQLFGKGEEASLLESSGKSSASSENVIDVPCIVLDDWCKRNGIPRIDFLRLDAGGLEYKILRSSPEMLKTVQVLVTKTYLNSKKTSKTPYFFLKKYLETNGFELLSHWYYEGQEGEAVFLRKCIFDSQFR